MRARRMMIAAVAALAGCSLVYADYDSRFAPSGPASDAAPPVLADGGAAIAGLAVTADGIFFYTSPGADANASVIKRVAHDGGGLATWWVGDAGVTAIVSDGVGRLAWVSGDAIWSARTDGATAVASVLVDGGVQASPAPIAADATQIARLGNTYPARCPVGGCVVAFVAPWGGTEALLGAPLDAGNVSPHALSVDALGTSVQLQAERSTEHLVARFSPDGGLACVGAVDGVARVFTTSGGALFTLDPSGNLAEYATTAAGCPTSASSHLSTSAVAVVVDDAGIYWVDDAGTVFRVAPAADGGTRLGAAGAQSSAIAVDDASVYVASGGSIFRLSKTPGK